MYGVKLTFDILDQLSKSSAPVTVSELCKKIAPNIEEYQTAALRARVLRRLHTLDKLQRITIEYKQTIIKTQYLVISSL